MLIEKISEHEMEMIDSCRRCYAFSESTENTSGQFASNSYILRLWEKAKAQHLFTLFGGELTLTKHLDFQKSFDELSEELDSLVDGVLTYGRSEREGATFYSKFLDFAYSKNLSNILVTKEEALKAERNIRQLMSTEALINNRYDGDDISILLPNGKIYELRNGCKTMRALSKLANAFNIEGFEDFRICHSQILNQKTLGGDLTISIHPLDYITMSDNDCDWESCMSWMNEGGYRQGTVEMMNSPTVIVAYLASERPMPMYVNGENRTWNNKKWRQLFVVDHGVICGVKDYPYQNAEITCAVLEWLRELAKERLGWEYSEIIPYSLNKDFQIPEYDYNMSFFLSSNHMYSDWGCLEKHYLMFNPQVIDNLKLYHKYSSCYEYSIPYSGPSECMVCGEGEGTVDFYDDSCLTCGDCQSTMACDCCNERVYGDEYYVIDGERYCSYCYEEYIACCAVCEEEHLRDNMMQIHVIPRLPEAVQNKLREEKIASDYSSFYRNLYEMPEIIYLRDYPDFYTCNDCFKQFCNEYLKDGCQPHYRRIEYEEKMCVYFDELKEEHRDEVYFVDNFMERALAGNLESGYHVRFSRPAQDN